MLVGAVHPVACISKFAYGFWMNKHAFVSICTFREKFTFFCRMVVWTFSLCLVTIWIVSTTYKLLSLCCWLLILSRTSFLTFLFLLLILYCCCGILLVWLLIDFINWPKPFKSLFLKFFCLVLR